MRWASLHCFPLSPPPVIAALPFHTLLLECRTTSCPPTARGGRQFACSRRRRRLPPPSLPPSISISSSSAAARTLLRSCTLHVGPAGPTELRASPLPCPPDIVLLLGKRCQRGLSSFSLFHNLPKGEREKRSWDTGYPRYPQLPFPSHRSSSFISRSVTVPLAHRPSPGEERGSFRCPTFYSFPLSKH